MASSLGFALLLASLAGLSTILGSLIIMLFKKPGSRFMSLILGFAAGVMILVSFAELLPEGIKEAGMLRAYLGFFCGMLGMFLIDALVPHGHMGEYHDAGIGTQTMSESCACERHGKGKGRHWRQGTSNGRLLKTGWLVALGIGIHNFPEGMATFISTMQDPKLGVLIAVAISLHNIPEGIAMSAPVWAATGSRKKAILWSALSGAAEPVGALIAALILMPILTPVFLGVVLATVAGIMIYISLDELVPVACSFKQENLSILGVILGMAVMVISLAVFR